LKQVGAIGKTLARFPKIIVALLAQMVALAVLAGIVWWLPWVVSPPYPLWALVIAQGVLAAFLSCRMGLPCWWRVIQFSLPVGLYLGVHYAINPVWALGIFLVLWLVFFNAIKERVPLYLTNATTRNALKRLIKRRKSVRFLDLGCGLGGNVVFMAQQVNVERSDGVETAPIPYLIAKLYSLLRGGEVFAMDLWKTQLDYYDVVYAFLSPEPMPKLWEKIREEMREDAVFVSNSFAVPDVEPSEVWSLSDRRETQLYVYYLSDFKTRPQGFANEAES
jgi:SAM-dependent methyltransferase